MELLTAHHVSHPKTGRSAASVGFACGWGAPLIGQCKRNVDDPLMSVQRHALLASPRMDFGDRNGADWGFFDGFVRAVLGEDALLLGQGFLRLWVGWVVGWLVSCTCVE
jgi:hypothetical protein